MPSGKQILLSVLSELSQHGQEDGVNRDSDKILRAALLFHCSTADETWARVSNTAWLKDVDDQGKSIREGIGLANESIFLSDIIEQLREEAQMPETLKARFPNLSPERYGEALETIWHLLSALQYWEGLASVENGGHLDLAERNRMLQNMLSKLKLYQANPTGYIRGDYKDE
jgi:hypothetical protein